MTPEKFDEHLLSRLEKTAAVLKSKAGEYAVSNERFHNFIRSAEILGTTRQKALTGMMVKHLVSVFDIVENSSYGVFPKDEVIEEKIGDSINYLILLEAMIKEDKMEYEKSKVQALNAGGAVV